MNEDDNNYIKKLNDESEHELSPVEMILEREKIVLEREKLQHEREMLQFERSKWESSQSFSGKNFPRSIIAVVVLFVSALFLVVGLLFGYILKNNNSGGTLMTPALLQQLSDTNIFNREIISDKLGDEDSQGATYLLILK